jgi:hypothetical protein
MSGITGMGTPSKVAPDVPVAPPVQAAPLPPMQAPVQQAPASDMDSLYQDAAQAAPSSNNMDSLYQDAAKEAAPVEDNPYSEIPGGGIINAIAKNVVPHAKEISYSFATTAKEKESFLKKTFGEDNFKADPNNKGEYLVRENKDASFTPFSPNFASNTVGRPGLESVSMGAGAIAGTLTPVPGGGIVGAGAGAVAGHKLADLLQEKAFDIPRDESRSAGKEALYEGTVGAGVQALTAGMGKLVASRAARASSEALMKREDIAANAAKDAMQLVQVNKDAGFISDVPGFNTPVIPSQIASLNPEAQGIAKELRDRKEMHGFVLKQGEIIADGYMKLADAASDGAFSKLKTSGSQDVGNQFIQGYKSVRKIEGQLIGSYRQKFIDEVGDGVVPAPKLAAKISELSDSLGFAVKDNKLVPPSVDDLVNKGYDEKTAKQVIDRVSKIGEEMYNGGDRLSAKRMNGMYTELSGLTDNLFTRGGQVDPLYRNTILSLKNAVRDDLTTGIGTTLPQGAQEGYQAALGKFSKIAGAADDLNGLLKNDQISAANLAKYATSKGKDNLDTMHAIRSIAEQTPGAWENVKANIFLNAQADATDIATGKMDLGKLTKSLNSMGPEMTEAIFGKDGGKQVQNFTKLAAMINNGTPELMASPGNRGLLKNILLSMKSLFAAGSAGTELLYRADKNKVLAKFLSKEGVDAVTEGLPLRDKSFVDKVLGDYMNRVAADAKSAYDKIPEALKGPQGIAPSVKRLTDVGTNALGLKPNGE